MTVRNEMIETTNEILKKLVQVFEINRSWSTRLPNENVMDALYKADDETMTEWLNMSVLLQSWTSGRYDYFDRAYGDAKLPDEYLDKMKQTREANYTRASFEGMCELARVILHEDAEVEIDALLATKVINPLW